MELKSKRAPRDIKNTEEKAVAPVTPKEAKEILYEAQMLIDEMQKQ